MHHEILENHRISADPPAPPHNPLWHTAKEYLTHWFVAVYTGVTFLIVDMVAQPQTAI